MPQDNAPARSAHATAQTFRLLSAGQLIDAPSTIAVIDPATGTAFAQAPACTAELLDVTVAAARKACAGWRATPIETRAAALLTLADRLQAHADEIGLLLTREQGRPLAMARGEVLRCVQWFRTVATLRLPLVERTDAAGLHWTTQRVPLGVVAAVAAWNFPLLLASMKLGPALLAGNTVILKPSPFTPLTALRLGELAQDLFPAGVLSVLSGGDDLGPLLSSHPGIDKVSFTGSTATGRRVMASAAATLKHITLELGGNDAAIVMPDVDVAATAKRLFMAAFLNSGQICIAAKRIYVHESIYDAFSQAFVAAVEAAPVGPGVDPRTLLGPVQNKLQFERVKSLIEATRAAGHLFLTGGDVPTGTGYFIPPAVVDNPPDDSRVVREEPFGPLVPLLRFRDVDEVVRRANDSEFGLAGSVWSADVAQAKAIGARLECGTVYINTSSMLDPLAPFAGHKQSGVGVENGLDGLLAFTTTQTMVA